MAKRSRKDKTKAKKQNAKQQRYRTIAIVSGVIALVSVGLFFLRQQQLPNVNLSEIPDESVAYAIQGRDHVTADVINAFEYNSNPPTSGPHDASPLTIRFYEQEMFDGDLIHNIEHGHIWMSYRDQDDEEAKDLLRSIHEEYPGIVIVSYRPQNDARIAAAAWGRLLELEELDEDQLLAFMVRHFDNAPESVPGTARMQ